MHFLAHMPSTVSDRTTNMFDRRPDNLSQWETFKKYIYDQENKTCCNRTTKSWMLVWFLLTITFSFFFGIFTLITFSHIAILRQLHPDSPKHNKLTQTSSGPGLSFVPYLQGTPAPIIWYTTRNNPPLARTDLYINTISSFLNNYENATASTSVEINDVGLFTLTELGPCANFDYGYSEKKPCIFLKLNRNNKWRAEGYTELPKDMPQSLKNYIDQSSKPIDKYVWINCKPESPADTEHVQNVTYYPAQGFNNNFFENSGSKQFLQPLIALKLETIDEGYVVTITCTTWAQNVKNTLTFSVYMDVGND